MTASATFLDTLAQAVGADAVTVEAQTLAYFANDVYRTGGLPLAVIRPASVVALTQAVKLCAAANVAMIPRGGGASYTDGYIRP